MEKYEYENMKTKIERMDKIHQLKIVEIIKNSLVRINESSKGISINLSCCTPETLREIKTYMDYVSIQEASLSSLEQEKKEIMENYFSSSEQTKK